MASKLMGNIKKQYINIPYLIKRCKGRLNILSFKWFKYLFFFKINKEENVRGTVAETQKSPSTSRKNLPLPHSNSNSTSRHLSVAHLLKFSQLSLSQSKREKSHGFQKKNQIRRITFGGDGELDLPLFARFFTLSPLSSSSSRVFSPFEEIMVFFLPLTFPPCSFYTHYLRVSDWPMEIKRGLCEIPLGCSDLFTLFDVNSETIMQIYTFSLYFVLILFWVTFLNFYSLANYLVFTAVKIG